MSPIPPVATNHTNGASPQHQCNHNFNHTKPNHAQGCNGNAESPVKETQPAKAKRGRPSKNESGQPHVNGVVKKRGRPPKVKGEEVPAKQSKITDTLKKAKRTVNRFKDVTKEELMERLLPDRIKPDLDILIIGINPGLFAVYKGHHYAGPGNHFWSCLNMSGLVPCHMTSDDDINLPNHGIGFSTIVERTTPGAKDLSSKEIREGAKRLIEKIQNFKPKIAVFNGKGIYEIFSKEIFGQKKKDFKFGTQENRIPGTETYIYVMPSSSARCAQFPRAQDKVHFYVKLKQLRDGIRGNQTEDTGVHEVSYSFDLQKATELAKVQNIKQEKIDPEYDAFDATKKEPGSFFPVGGAPPSGVGKGKLDANNNKLSEGVGHDLPGTSGATQASNNNNNTANNIKTSQNKKEDSDVSMRHSHLIRYLRQDHDAPGPSHGQVAPLTLSHATSKLQQDVSEEQRQERVGEWVREQHSVLEYDSEPPMGMEERLDNVEAGSGGGAETDGASQLSMMSAGISGSASESTSGYGSADASSRRVRLDRVEMWVLEQQHVRRNNSTNQQLQHSIQAASSSAAPSTGGATPVVRADAPQNATRFQLAPAVSWFPTSVNGYPHTSSIGVMHTPMSLVSAPGGSALMFSMAGRKPNLQPSPSLDPGAGTSAALVSNASGGRNSPYRAPRSGSKRDGSSGSSFGVTIRPPVPLYSSWGGEGSNSGGSHVSSPVVPFVAPPSTPPNPNLAFNGNNSNNNDVHALHNQNVHLGIMAAWQNMQDNNLLAPYSSM